MVAVVISMGARRVQQPSGRARAAVGAVPEHGHEGDDSRAAGHELDRTWQRGHPGEIAANRSPQLEAITRARLVGQVGRDLAIVDPLRRGRRAEPGHSRHGPLRRRGGSRRDAGGVDGIPGPVPGRLGRGARPRAACCRSARTVTGQKGSERWRRAGIRDGYREHEHPPVEGSRARRSPSRSPCR